MAAQQVPAIQVRGLEKSYKQLHVLRGVDFDVARGSIFALLGSNGAGKTTGANILSTLLKADAGTASVNGFDVATQAADVRESISLTGQFAAVDDILTGRENLVLVAQLRHLKDPGTIADDLLARFWLTDAAARRVSTPESLCANSAASGVADAMSAAVHQRWLSASSTSSSRTRHGSSGSSEISRRTRGTTTGSPCRRAR